MVSMVMCTSLQFLLICGLDKMILRQRGLLNLNHAGESAPSGGGGKRGSTTRYSILSDPRLSQLFALSSQLEALAQSIDVQPPSSQNQPQKSKKTAGSSAGLCKQTTTTTSGGLLGTASPARYPP